MGHQAKMYFSLDFLQGTLKLAHLELIAPGGNKDPSNYKTTQVMINLDTFRSHDIMELHKQTGEGVFRDDMKYTTITNKLQGSVTHLERLHKNEKAASKAKQIKIGELEKKNPSYLKVLVIKVLYKFSSKKNIMKHLL